MEASEVQGPDSDDMWTFVLITPDALASGAFDATVEILERGGFEVVAGRVLGLSVPTMARVYAVASTTPRQENFGGVPAPAHLFESLYSLGPACLLMLRRERGQAAEAVNQCKGNTRPEAALPGTVRHLGENAIMNLLHCPDDTQAAEQELAILVGNADAERLQRLAVTGGGGLGDVLSLDAVRPSLPAARGWEVMSFPAVANRIRRRALQTLALRSHHDLDTLDALRSAHALLSQESVAIGSLPTSLSRMKCAQDFTKSIHADLSKVATAAGEHALVAGLAALRDLYSLFGSRDTEAVAALGTSGAHITAVERAVIETHGFAFTPHPDIDDLYVTFG